MAGGSMLTWGGAAKGGSAVAADASVCVCVCTSVCLGSRGFSPCETAAPAPGAVGTRPGAWPQGQVTPGPLASREDRAAGPWFTDVSSDGGPPPQGLSSGSSQLLRPQSWSPSLG